MWNWLTGKQKRGELPTYAQLERLSSRTMPAELVREEASEESEERRLAIADELRHSNHVTVEAAPIFVSLELSPAPSVIGFDLPFDEGRCLPVFTSPLRAADYRRLLVAPPLPVMYRVSTPAQLFEKLNDVRRIGFVSYTVDRCPRCRRYFAAPLDSIASPETLLAMWIGATSYWRVRAELYLKHALLCAQAGQLDEARDVALEMVGHVTQEMPRVHLLLGALGVARGEPDLVDDARRFLQYLKHEPWARELEAIVDAGRVNFENLP